MPREIMSKKSEARAWTFSGVQLINLVFMLSMTNDLAISKNRTKVFYVSFLFMEFYL